MLCLFVSIFLFVRIMRKVVGGCSPNLCPAYTSLVFRLHQSSCWHVLPRNSLIKVAFTLPLKTSTELNMELNYLFRYLSIQLNIELIYSFRYLSFQLNIELNYLFRFVLPRNSLIKVTSTLPLKTLDVKYFYIYFLIKDEFQFRLDKNPVTLPQYVKA